MSLNFWDQQFKKAQKNNTNQGKNKADKTEISKKVIEKAKKDEKKTCRE